MASYLSNLRIHPVRLSHRALLCSLLGGGVFLTGCWHALSPSPSTPREQSDVQWMPQWIHPPVFRDLPNAADVAGDFQAWRKQDAASTWRSRCYRATLWGEARQRDYKVDHLGGETPLGRVVTTEASFYYDDPTRGTYRLVWKLRGKHSPDFLRLTESKREFLLYFSGREGGSGIPVVTILGVEGVGPNPIAWGGEPGLSGGQSK